MKLVEKARSFLLTDRNTPILGPLCQAVERVVQGNLALELDMKDQASELVTLRYYHSEAPVDQQYPNENRGNWMDYFLCSDPVLQGFDITRFLKALSESTTLEQLLDLPICCEPVPIDGKLTAVVTGPFDDVTYRVNVGTMQAQPRPYSPKSPKLEELKRQAMPKRKSNERARAFRQAQKAGDSKFKKWNEVGRNAKSQESKRAPPTERKDEPDGETLVLPPPQTVVLMPAGPKRNIRFGTFDYGDPPPSLEGLAAMSL